jgi:hypothetical protein
MGGLCGMLEARHGSTTTVFEKPVLCKDCSMI